MVLGTGYRVAGTGYRVPGTCYLLPGTGYLVPGGGGRLTAKYQAPLTTETRYPLPATRY